MLKRIVAAFDGSHLAREAFSYAERIAGVCGASLLAVHVFEPSVNRLIAANPALGLDPMAASAAPPDVDAADAAEERTWAEGEFAALASRCAASGIPFESRIMTGLLLESLCQGISGNDMIAIGMKGRFRRTGIGSTTRALVHKAPCPVLVAGGPFRPIDHILSVHDGTPSSRRGVDFACRLSQQAKWATTVLACSRTPGGLKHIRDEAAALAPGATVLESATSPALEADLIALTAQKDRSAMLVLGAYADSWFHDLLFGSTTAQVLSQLGGPAILVH